MTDSNGISICLNPSWRDIFDYDESVQSCLVWKIARSKIKIGNEVGSKHKKGYIRVRYNYKNYLAHRIVYELCTGEYLGNDQVDHKDGNTSNNCIDNLRRINSNGQSQNLKMYSTNTSGYTGVRLCNMKGNEYAQAYWNFEGCKRFFMVRTDKVAFGLELCKLVREEAIDKLNWLGAKYTDRHGMKE